MTWCSVVVDYDVEYLHVERNGVVTLSGCSYIIVGVDTPRVVA
jgi:hypothetical protein